MNGHSAVQTQLQSTTWFVCIGFTMVNLCDVQTFRHFSLLQDLLCCKMILFFFRSCSTCVRDIGCGYCFMDTGQQPSNGSCLPVPHDRHGSVLNNGSATGRCEGDNLPDGLEWAYGYCPTNVAWIVTLGLVTYLAFFAPGM